MTPPTHDPRLERFTMAAMQGLSANETVCDGSMQSLESVGRCAVTAAIATLAALDAVQPAAVLVPRDEHGDMIVGTAPPMRRNDPEPVETDEQFVMRWLVYRHGNELYASSAALIASAWSRGRESEFCRGKTLAELATALREKGVK